MTLAVRAYRAGDRAACHTVFYEAVRHGAARFYDAAQRAAWAPCARHDPAEADRLLDQTCVVAVSGTDIVGFMSLCDDGYLDMAFVLPRVMGTGVADALYRALIAQARLRGQTRLTVHASHLARRFLARRGWHLDAEERHAMNGQVLERFCMSICLEAGEQ